MENKIIVPEITAPSRRQLLIVDDEKALVTVLMRIMKSDLLTAIGTTSPLEAKNLINNLNNGDLVLSDFHMPEMTGLELAEITSEIRRQKAIKFFIMSGAASFMPEGVKIRNAIGQYIDGFIEKGFDNKVLKEMLLGA